MKRRKFLVQFFVEVEIDQRLLDSVLTDEWRKLMFPFYQATQVAEHIAFNMVQGTPLTSIDGYADQDPKRVKIGQLDIDCATEVQPEPKPRKRSKPVANEEEDAHGSNPIRAHEEPNERRSKKR